MITTRAKVLMLTTQLGYGGAETSFIRLANYLSQRADVTVALFTSDYGMESYAKGHEKLNAKVELLDKKFTLGRIHRWLRRISRVRALKAQHDVCISFLSGPNLVNALSGKRDCSIVSLRGSRHFDPVSPWLQRMLFRFLLDPITYYLAGHISPVCPGLKHELIGAKRKERARSIPPFIDRPALEAAMREPLPEKYAALQGQKVIVGVGRLSVEKGFQHLIRVFALLSKAQPGAKLLLVGDGPMQKALRDQCARSDLAVDDTSPGTSAVIFAGYQKNVMPFIRVGKVFALSSATEGFPSVLLEAMVAGVPVLAADTPWGARAIIHEYADGLPRPYPTRTPTERTYGTMMPRIDQPANDTAWANVLIEFITGTRRAPAAAMERPDLFSTANVGLRWDKLIKFVREGV